jgi:hypothetical protein
MVCDIHVLEINRCSVFQKSGKRFVNPERRRSFRMAFDDLISRSDEKILDTL